MVENWITFQSRIANLPSSDRESIDWAYQLSKAAHRHQSRETGERYFEHPRAVTLILMDECKIKDPDIIIGSLLHDTPEDTAIFGSILRYPYSRWKTLAYSRLTKMFGEKSASMVTTLTKPFLDHIEITSKEQAYKIYINNLWQANPETLLIKMSDRLHNLRTLKNSSQKKKLKQIYETEITYYPLFQKAKVIYPTETEYLLAQIAKEINLLEETIMDLLI